jgi:hypothetical protein
MEDGNAIGADFQSHFSQWERESACLTSKPHFINLSGEKEEITLMQLTRWMEGLLTYYADTPVAVNGR